MSGSVLTYTKGFEEEVKLRHNQLNTDTARQRRGYGTTARNRSARRRRRLQAGRHPGTSLKEDDHDPDP